MSNQHNKLVTHTDLEENLGSYISVSSDRHEKRVSALYVVWLQS